MTRVKRGWAASEGFIQALPVILVREFFLVLEQPIDGWFIVHRFANGQDDLLPNFHSGDTSRVQTARSSTIDFTRCGYRCAKFFDSAKSDPKL